MGWQSQPRHFPHRLQQLRCAATSPASGGRHKIFCLPPLAGEVAAQHLWLAGDGGQTKKCEAPDDASFAGLANHFRTTQQSRAKFTRITSLWYVKLCFDRSSVSWLGCCLHLFMPRGFRPCPRDTRRRLCDFQVASFSLLSAVAPLDGVVLATSYPLSVRLFWNLSRE